MNLENKYFVRFNFSKEQIEQNLAGAHRDLKIAENSDILDVKFTYAYTALIKGGIALLGHRQLKTKSMPGHQAKIIEKLAQILNDQSIEILGNTMRQKRNQDFYSGGIELTEKECKEYLDFVKRVLERLEEIIRSHKDFR
jgi:HEPN domain-containing protein